MPLAQRKNCAVPNKKLFEPMVRHMSLSKTVVQTYTYKQTDTQTTHNTNTHTSSTLLLNNCSFSYNLLPATGSQAAPYSLYINNKWFSHSEHVVKYRSLHFWRRMCCWWYSLTALRTSRVIYTENKQRIALW